MFKSNQIVAFFPHGLPFASHFIVNPNEILIASLVNIEKKKHMIDTLVWSMPDSCIVLVLSGVPVMDWLKTLIYVWNMQDGVWKY